MGKRISLACLGLLWLVASQSVFAQRDYQDYNQLTLRLKRLGAQYSNLCTLTSVGKTATGKE
ncbi:MAG: hypothetical protein ACO1OQ_07505, partial [Rufibacter sp.]